MLCPLGEVNALVPDQGPGGPLVAEGAQPRPWVIILCALQSGCQAPANPLGRPVPQRSFSRAPAGSVGDSSPQNLVGCSLRGPRAGAGLSGEGAGHQPGIRLGTGCAVDSAAPGAGTARSRRSGPLGSSSTRAGLNPEFRKESVLSSLWVCGRRGGEHGARGQPSGTGRGRGARTGRAGWSCRRRAREGCGAPRGPGWHGGWVGRAVLLAEERLKGPDRAARSQPEPPWTLWAFVELFWTRLSLSVEVPRLVRRAGG